MKTAAKVFIIIGMVAGFWTILPLIFGGIALSKMSKKRVDHRVEGLRFAVC